MFLLAIPPEVIAEIKYKNDIESVISPYVQLKRRGKNLVGLCPFHNEKTPSFTVYPENGSFYCFGCGTGGDIFTFTGLIENLDYIEAVRLLADRSGVSIPEKGMDDSYQKLKTTILAINRETARFYHQILMSDAGRWAMEYLTGRGLTVATIRHFGLGCAPDSWDSLYRHLTAKGFSVSDLLQANVISKSSRGTYYDRFRNRVVFPIINVRGNVVAFSARQRPGDTKAAGKYINSSETPVYKKGENLYGFNFAKNHCAERVILVEGNMDVVSLHQAGFPNTVAALGTAFTLEQARLLSRYTKEIVITLDSDAAGQKAVKRALETLKNSGMPIRVLVLPDGKDPDEYIKKNSPEKFEALLNGAISDMEYKLLNAEQGLDTQTDDGKLQYLRRAAAILAEVSDRMTEDYYAGKLSERFGIAKNALMATIEDMRRKEAKQQEKKQIERVISPRYSQNDINPQKRFHKKAAVAEETVLAVLLQHPDLYGVCRAQLPESLFVTELNRRLYRLLCELLEQQETADLSLLGQSLSAAEMGYAVSLQNSVKAASHADETLRDSIKVLKEEALFNNTGEDDGDAWENQMRAIIETKKGD